VSDFVKVADLSEIPDPGKKVFELDDRLVVVVHAGGQVYCLEDLCTHDGGPLGEGQLDGHTIACPRHGAKFDIRDGRPLTMPATEATLVHEAKIENGVVYVKISTEA
jgi:3-phenylpropionate/trans-cinnamate dioxygenase ferredoxin subunit